jgi:cytochrome b561
MNQQPARTGYSGLQIALHWIVVALVFFQLVFGEDMTRLFRAVSRGQTPEPDVALWGNFHIWVGFAILAAVALRLALRLRHVPALEEGKPS